jgi:DHA1 family bicyclomycin/chloramphenicol resistance-like MFS transporter
MEGGAFLISLRAVVVVFNTTGALSMEPLGEVTGTASSVFEAICTVGGALFGYGIQLLYNGTVTPVFAANSALAVGAMVCILFTESARRFRAGCCAGGCGAGADPI